MSTSSPHWHTIFCDWIYQSNSRCAKYRSWCTPVSSCQFADDAAARLNFIAHIFCMISVSDHSRRPTPETADSQPPKPASNYSHAEANWRDWTNTTQTLFIVIEHCTWFNVSHAHLFIVLTLINIECGPRYKPPGVSRGSPGLHCLLIISVL